MSGYLIMKNPGYYDKFKCTGEACTQKCCNRWGYIYWRKEEYEKLLAADMTDELREKVKNSFKPLTQEEKERLGDGMNIVMPQSRCPFLTETGLCSIQKELGTDYLSETCNIFPRTNTYSNTIITQYATMSCGEVIKLLLEDKNAMELVSYQKSEKEIKSRISDGRLVIFNRLSIKNFNVIFDLLYNVVADESYSVETGLILGAMVVKKLDDFQDRPERIPEVLRLLSKELRTTKQIKMIEDIKPNLNIRLGVMGEVFKKIPLDINIYRVLDLLYTGKAFDVEKYNRGVCALDRLLSGKEYFFRNYALNMMLELRAPFYRPGQSMFENWLYLCAIFSMSKLLVTAAAYNEEHIDSVVYSLSLFNRGYRHDDAIYNTVIDFLKQSGIHNTAHIACMLK